MLPRKKREIVLSQNNCPGMVCARQASARRRFFDDIRSLARGRARCIQRPSVLAKVLAITPADKVSVSVLKERESTTREFSRVQSSQNRMMDQPAPADLGRLLLILQQQPRHDFLQHARRAVPHLSVVSLSFPSQLPASRGEEFAFLHQAHTKWKMEGKWQGRTTAFRSNGAWGKTNNGQRNSPAHHRHSNAAKAFPDSAATATTAWEGHGRTAAVLMDQKCDLY